MDYKKLLNKAKQELPKIKESSERFEILKVKGHIQGYKTIISNFTQIANNLGRDQNHLLKFLLKELASRGEVIKTSLILDSRISASRVNEKIQQYARQYVLCKECGKPDTKITKKGNLFKIKCTACGASYPVISKM